MPSAKLKLKTSQVLKNGSHPIIIQVLKDTKKSIITLGLTCVKSEWNDKSNLPKNRRLSLICQKSLLEVEELLFEGEEKGWSAKKITNIYTGKDTKKLMMFNYMSEINFSSKQGVSTNTTDQYFRSKFVKFLNGKDIAFSDLTFQLLNDYKKFLEESGIKTAYRYLSYLRQVYNFAVDNDEFVPKSNPFKKSLFNFKELESSINRNLSLKQISDLFKLDNSKFLNSYKDQALDFWKFCFLMRGINLIDLAMIKREDIQGEYYIMVREKLKTKTSQKQRIKIFPEAREILNKYSDKSNEYVFPIFSNGQNKDLNKEDYKTYKYKKNTLNENLKRIGKEIKSEFILTSMSSRYSFINIAKSEGIPFLFLQELIGHKTLTTTDIYLDVFPQSQIDNYHRKVIDKVLSQ
ncbi:tyrosine-type recombinase/integrase [Tenacibaculum aiptasiae]|uniref:tyrosine-type recombinase/integrase n=1 Tax=Tenacibaculum aiptasiae TaxID=426481 RepID=UPI00232AB660|nr:tyrosine-type recombinase/integrase [Tenacibaculum aiptasiae]